MSKKLNEMMRLQGMSQYPKEACGLLLAVGKKTVPVACENVAEDPLIDFRISAEEVATWRAKGEIVGVWHTHIDRSPKPSPSDVVGCESTGVQWFIMSVSKVDDVFHLSEIELLEPTGIEIPYVGRPYVFGVTDCWSLVRDYYHREYGIALGDYPRIDNFWKKGHNFFGENWAKEGFDQLIDQEPQPGDLFIIQTDPENPNHIATYIGSDMILHHCHGRLSRRDIYGGYWSKHTTHHLRYRTKC